MVQPNSQTHDREGFVEQNEIFLILTLVHPLIRFNSIMADLWSVNYGYWLCQSLWPRGRLMKSSQWPEDLLRSGFRTLASSVLIRCFLNRCRFVKTKFSSCLISFNTSITATLVLQSSLIKYIDCWQMFVSSLISGTWYSGTFSMFSNHLMMLVTNKVVKYFGNVRLSIR